MMEFTFDYSPWEQALENLQPGDEMNMLTLMSLTEEEDEDTVLEALEALAEKGVSLSIRDLPNLPVGGNMALRLREWLVRLFLLASNPVLMSTCR